MAGLGIDWAAYLLTSSLILSAVIIPTVFSKNHRLFPRPNIRVWLSLVFASIIAAAVGLQLELQPNLFSSQSLELPAGHFSITLVPVVLALYAIIGSRISAPAAMFVGFVYGMSVAIWQTQHVLDVLSASAVALFVGSLVNQKLSGTLYRLFRFPVIALLLGAFVEQLFLVFGGFAYNLNADSYLLTLDAALQEAGSAMPVLVANALIGGLLAVIFLSLIGVGQGKKRRWGSVFSRKLYVDLFFEYLLLIIILIIAIAINTYGIVRDNVETNFREDLSAATAQVAVELDDYVDFIGDMVSLSAVNIAAGASEPGSLQTELRDLHSTAKVFDLVALLNNDGSIESSYPAIPDAAVIGEHLARTFDDAALEQVARDNLFPLVLESDFGLVFVSSTGSSDAAPFLYTRLPYRYIYEETAGAARYIESGKLSVLTSKNQVIYDPEVNLEAGNRTPPPAVAGSLSGEQTLSRVDLTVRMNVVPEQIASAALRSGLLIIGLLALGSISAGLLVFMVGGTISEPLKEIVNISSQLTQGNLKYPIEAEGSDEISTVINSFRGLREAMRRREREQKILSDVSQSVFRTINLNEAIPRILRAAIDGSEATSARCFITFASNQRMLTFSEGPHCDDFAYLDRPIRHLLQSEEELELASPDMSRAVLRIKDSDTAPTHILAYRIRESSGLSGGFWMAWSHNHPYNSQSRLYLDTLDRNLDVLIRNVREFTSAEVGRKQLAAVLQSTGDGVLVVDDDNRVRLLNQPTEQIFGITSGSVIDRSLGELPELEKLSRALETAVSEDRTIELDIAPGNYYELTVRRLANTAGRSIGRVAILHDISSYKNAEMVKNELLTAVTHDFKSPLAMIRNYATMLSQSENIGDSQIAWLQKIQLGIREMDEMVLDLLSLRRLQSKGQLVISTFSANNLLEQVESSCKTLAESRGATIIFAVDEQLPRLEGDYTILAHALKNLVSNAVKYGGNEQPVVVTAKASIDQIVFLVQDRGPGIAKEELDMIFEEFYRAKSNRAKVQGAGLGLTLVKAAVERHGGRIWCESEEGMGATFIMSLPLPRSGASARAAAVKSIE